MELSDLINADFDVSLTGFIPAEIDELLTDVLPGTGNEEEPYTTKIDTPVYEPSGGKPDISELYDDTKTQELISRIRSASLDPDIEKFLLCAAERHSNTSLAWGAGVQFNPTESVAIDIAYEGSGSGDWRTDGFIVGVGYKF